MATFGDRELISDYRFLEEGAGLRDSSARDTQRMLQSQKLQQLRQLQTSVGISALDLRPLAHAFVCSKLEATSLHLCGGAHLPRTHPGVLCLYTSLK